VPESCPDLLIAGASARAAAFSAVRGGLVVAAADLFADRDLAAVAEATMIRHWPNEIERWAARYPSSVPFLYTGGLENYPELLDRIGQRRPLTGVAGASLELSRNPETLFELLSGYRVAVAPLRQASDRRDVQWLLKPRRGAGGRGIRRLGSEEEVRSSEEYVQEFVAGTAGSAAFLAMADGRVELIGLCESLRGLDPGANSFAYYGSIVRRDWMSESLERAGCALASVGLRGLFGIDFVRRDDGEAVIVEVNPRFTASMELHELSSGRSLVAEHLEACGALARPLPFIEFPTLRDAVTGKRVVYAPQQLTCHLDQVPSCDEIRSGGYTLADLPHRGVPIDAAMPICTVIARAEDVPTCRKKLTEGENAVLAQCEIDSPR